MLGGHPSVDARPPLARSHSRSGDQLVAASHAGPQGGPTGSAPCAGEASSGLAVTCGLREDTGSVGIRTPPRGAPACSKLPVPRGASGSNATGEPWSPEGAGGDGVATHTALGGPVEAAGFPA